MKNVPKLRFNGFSDEWREFELGDLAEISKGKYNPSKDKLNYKCIELEHIAQNDGKILGYVDSKGQNSIKNKFNKGEVLFGKLRPYLKKYWLSEFEGVCSSEIWVLNGKRVTNPFLYRIVQSDKFDTISNISSGSKMPRADWNYMSTEVFNIPTTEEQEKIASFLTKVDKIIEKQEEKVSNLEQYKKGMMQKIFSQEIRFKKDDGEEYPEWTVKKLCEVANKFDYGMNSAAIEFDGENKYIRITDIDEKSNKYKKDNLVSPDGDLDDRYLVEENDILFARTGASVGKTYLYDKNDGKVYFAGFLIRVNVNKENNAKFIFMQTQTEEYRKWIEIMSMRSGQPGVNSQEYSTFQVKVPCLEEQDKIANFLSKIDSIVEKEKEKLEEMRVWKKGLLQGMFV